MSPRVCLDIRPAQTGSKYAGTGVYARELVQALSALEHNLELWYLVLSNYPLPDLDLPLDRLVRVWRSRKPERWHGVYDMLGLSAQLATKGFDLAHSLVPGMIQKIGNMRVIVTIHDLIPMLFPDDYMTSPDGRWLYQRRLRTACYADYLITVSRATKQDLIKHLKIQTEKISVIHEASSSDFRPVSKKAIATFKERVGLPEYYILYLGGYSPRKNVPLLIRAFHELGQLRREVKLVLAGTTSRGAGRFVRDLVIELGLQNDVIWPGYIADIDLPTLYSGASLFIYPSLYEGFGLPVLEAMACGTPVITSYAGSLAEVAGDAALLVDPRSQKELVTAIRRAIESLVLQDDLRHRGQAHASTFSWERCARETLAVYEQVLS